MDPISLTLGAFIGFALGLGLSFFMRAKQREQEKQNLDVMLDRLRGDLGNLSMEAVSKSTDEILKFTQTTLKSERQEDAQELTSKKGLIDQRLDRMNQELEGVSKLVKDLEKDRVDKFSELATHLKNANDQSGTLIQLTGKLNEVLASTKARGQWGERMADDVLRMAGFIENVNYLKNKSMTQSAARPDFTFLLPNQLKLNMDVKFPLNNYLNYLDTTSETDKDRFLKDFLRDVKARIKEVTGREYINREENTLDYVLLFIPNENIYTFIHEHDSSLMESGLKEKVVFCSPITLFAVLAVVRQAVDNFALERTSNEILKLLSVFKKQWSQFVSKLETVGKRIGDAQKEFESLNTTRRRQLEKPLNQIDDLRHSHSDSDGPQMEPPSIEHDKTL